MTFTTPNGIRYPNDPTAYADLIQFFKELSEDVDTKFVPKTGSNEITGELTVKTLRSSNGGTTQSATVLQTGPSAASAFAIYDDNIKLDNSPGRRLVISGAHGTDVAIGARGSGEALNKIAFAASTIDLYGAVTINGTLNITGTKTISVNFEADYTLAANATTWRLLPVTQVGFTFVTPPSGAVIIGMGGFIPTQGYSTMLSYEIKLGPTIGSGTQVLTHKPASFPDTQPPPYGIAANGTGAGSAQWHSAYTAYLHKLTPNTTYNVRPWYRSANTTALLLYRHYFIVQPDL